MTHQKRIQSELEQIRTSHDGLLRAEDVVAFARDETTALHLEFEWSDTEAAKQYRLDQARRVIRLAVTVVRANNADLAVPVYVSLVPDRATPGGGYRPLVDVLNDEEKCMQLLRQALREFSRVRDKYKTLAELAPIFTAIDDVARGLNPPDDVVDDDEDDDSAEMCA